MLVDGDNVRVVVVGTVETDPHFVTRLFTFTEPSPVARSYPAPAVHASVDALLGSRRTPLLPEIAELHAGVPPAHGTLLVPKPIAPRRLLLPLVTSLKMQVEASATAEVQLALAIFARAYKT